MRQNLLTTKTEHLTIALNALIVFGSNGLATIGAGFSKQRKSIRTNFTSPQKALDQRRQQLVHVHQ